MRVWLLHSNEPTLHLLLEKLDVPHGTGFPVHPASTCILYWGCFHPERQEQLSLQPVKNQLRAANRATMTELLQLHGLQSDTQAIGERFTYEYLVPVFHLQALALFQKPSTVFYGAGSVLPLQMQEEGSFTEDISETPSYHGVRAKREAVKAIYALGLDYGVVRIGVRPAGQLVVIEVQVVPLLNERLAELFAEAINRYAAELAEVYIRKEEALLGADPEFLLRNSRGKVVFASSFMDKEGAVGCDAIVLPSYRKIYPLAELRPNPSYEVNQLVAHIHHTMQLASRKITDPSLQWLAGGMPVKGFPLGGHLHFSGVWLNCELLRTLDSYLALPMVLLEAPTTAQRKPRYGFLGDFRKQRHGGFEYRVLPSWLVSPRITKGVVALAKLIADGYRKLNARPLRDPAIQRAYYQTDKMLIRPLIPALWRDLMQLPGYSKLERHISPLKTMLLQMDAWDEQSDIRKKWQIGPFSRKQHSSVHS